MFSPIIAGVHRHAAALAGAILIGIYLGASTTSEIDPFYKQGQGSPSGGGSSYTIDGWRGADAAPPPISRAVEAPMQLVAMGRSLAPALQRYYSSYPSDAGAAGYVMIDEAMPGDGKEFADPDAVVDAVPEPALEVRECAEGDVGCAPVDEVSDDGAGAPATDF